MRRSAAILMVVGMASIAILAQDRKPNFNGKWTRDAQKNGPNDNPFATGKEVTEIKVDATTFTLTGVTRDGAPSVTVYNLNGKEATLTGGGSRGVNRKYTAKMEGNTIVVKLTEDRPGAATRTIVYSMDGAWLVIETPNPVPKVWYKKVTGPPLKHSISN